MINIRILYIKLKYFIKNLIKKIKMNLEQIYTEPLVTSKNDKLENIELQRLESSDNNDEISLNITKIESKTDKYR